MSSSQLWRVAVSAPLREPLTYKSELPLDRGLWVNLPLGNRKSTGLVLGPTDELPNFELKSVSSVETELPRLPEPYLRWVEWLSDYYHYPLGLIVDSCRPPLEKRIGRGSKKTPVVPTKASTLAPDLTNEQKSCLQSISKSKGFHCHLLHGVTGSGKTEVYLQLIAETLKSGQSALVLVPEISLTPQLIDRFASRFGNDIAAYHSQMTPREKTDHWWEIVSGQKRVMIGARSALFCPHPNLGLIVIDEEHEPSYKQDDKLKYNARDSAVMLARFHNCPIVLGSATPSLESWDNAQSGKYILHQLKNRVHDAGLPSVEVVDLRQQVENSLELPSWLSSNLYEKMVSTLEKGEQVALFLNRRGMANSVLCNHCGFSIECPNCDINLTLHSKSHLICHYCDYHENLKEVCPSCRSGELVPLGLGTEKLEQELNQLFP
ncbi:MAG: primosomal protein N' [Bdellovibrionales bacterium]